MLPAGVPQRVLPVASSSVLKHEVDLVWHVLKLGKRKNILKSAWLNHLMLVTSG